MHSLDSLDADSALERFARPLIEFATDETTGKQFRQVIHACPFGADVSLVVVVTSEPRLVRRARRFKWIGDILLSNARDFGSSGKIIQRNARLLSP